jgi:hypothetical protein
MNKAWTLLLLAAICAASISPARAFWSSGDSGGDDASESADAEGNSAGTEESVDAGDSDETPEEKEARELAELNARYQKEYEEKMAAWELEITDPKYALEPVTLSSGLACNACDHITSRLGDAVLSVTYKVQDKPLKERRAIAEAIVDTVCDGLVNVEATDDAFVLHSNDLKFDLETLALKAKKKRKNKKKKKKTTTTKNAGGEEVEDDKENMETDETTEDIEGGSDASATIEENAGERATDSTEENAADAATSEEASDTDAEAEGTDEGRRLETDEEEEEEEGEQVEEEEPEVQTGNDADTERLRAVCKLMLANHGSRLKSSISGFYKDITGSSLRKKLCYQWQEVCIPPAKTKLAKREKCLMKVFKATSDADWDAVDKYLECAQAELKVKKKKKKKKKTKKADEDGSEDEGNAENTPVGEAERGANDEEVWEDL